MHRLKATAKLVVSSDCFFFGYILTHLFSLSIVSPPSRRARCSCCWAFNSHPQLNSSTCLNNNTFKTRNHCAFACAVCCLSRLSITLHCTIFTHTFNKSRVENRQLYYSCCVCSLTFRCNLSSFISFSNTKWKVKPWPNVYHNKSNISELHTNHLIMAFINVAEWTPHHVADWLKGKRRQWISILCLPLCANT